MFFFTYSKGAVDSAIAVSAAACSLVALVRVEVLRGASRKFGSKCRIFSYFFLLAEIYL